MNTNTSRNAPAATSIGLPARSAAAMARSAAIQAASGSPSFASAAEHAWYVVAISSNTSVRWSSATALAAISRSGTKPRSRSVSSVYRPACVSSHALRVLLRSVLSAGERWPSSMARSA